VAAAKNRNKVSPANLARMAMLLLDTRLVVVLEPDSSKVAGAMSVVNKLARVALQV
jgi:hypothetical protein